MHTTVDCQHLSLEAARRRLFYARSAAGAAQRLLHDHAIPHDEYLRRLTAERVAQRCLDLRLGGASVARAVLMDGEQVGID